MIVALLSVFLLIGNALSTRYEPNWKSLDARPLPSWYDEAKFGIFLHWGVFSVPSFGSEWFWWNWQGAKQMGYIDFMKNNYRPDFTYPDFAKEFHAEFFDPVYWAEIFKASGAKYIVLTSKHHEGFTNWPSQVSWNWNSMDVGPHRDLVGDLAAAIRNKTDIHFGLYHSLFEWFNPIYLKDKANNFSTQEFVFTKALPELVEIVNKYKPEVIWSDGDWEATDKYWNSTEFIAWLYNDSPVKDSVVINDRWGAGIACHHGGYYTCSDRYNPGVLLKHKWENAMTVDKFSWGYRRNAHLSDYLTIDELLQTFAETISCGGNLLMNVGPASDGIIMPIFEERLRQMGQWLGVNGEAVYSSIPWTHQNDTITPGVWYTCKNASGVVSVYAIMLNWPSDNTLVLGAPLTTDSTMVTMLGYSGEISWTRGTTTGLTMDLSPIPVNKLPCDWAWVFKLTGLASKPAYGYDQYVLRFKSETVVVDWN